MPQILPPSGALAPPFIFPSIKQQRLLIQPMGLEDVSATELHLGEDPNKVIEQPGLIQDPATALPAIPTEATKLPSNALGIQQEIGLDEGLRDLADVQQPAQGNSDLADVSVLSTDQQVEQRESGISLSTTSTSTSTDDLRLGTDFLVNKSQLGRGILSVRYAKNNKKLNGWRNLPVSSNFAKAVNHLAKGGGIPGRSKMLTAEEKSLLVALANRTRHIGSKPKWLHAATAPTAESHLNEIKLVMGEMEAGNNSVYLRHQLKKLLSHRLTTQTCTPAVVASIHQAYL